MSRSYVPRSYSASELSPCKVGDYLFGKVLTQADIEALAPSPEIHRPPQTPADLARRTRQRIDNRKSGEGRYGRFTKSTFHPW